MSFQRRAAIALGLVAVWDLAVIAPASAGPIGASVCGDRNVALQGMGLRSSEARRDLSNGDKLNAVVVDAGKLGRGFSAGDQVVVTVTDARSCVVQVSPKGAGSPVRFRIDQRGAASRY